MPISASEIQWFLPASDGKLGVKANSNVQRNLFPDVTGSQNRDGMTDYRWLILLNTSSLTFSAVKLYWKLAMAGGANMAFALDTIGVQAAANKLIDTSIIPSTFVAPTTVGAGLTVPNLLAGQAVGVWIRRTVSNAAALNPERNTITVSGTSPA